MIVEPERAELDVHRHGDERRALRLRRLAACALLVEGEVLLAEVDGGRGAQREVFVQPPLAQHSDAEADVLTVVDTVPLLPVLRRDVAVVLKVDALRMDGAEETVVKPAIVDVRLVLHLAPLGAERLYAAEKCGQQDYGDYPETSHTDIYYLNASGRRILYGEER